jgi:hypothetical protein
MHPMVPLDDEAQVEARSSLFRGSANLESTISLEIILNAPDGTAR